MTYQSLCAPENTLTSVARQLLGKRARALLWRLLFASVFGVFGVIENYISAWFACPHCASLCRSLDGGHFDALGTSISSCALRHRAGSTMEFAKLSDEASRETSPPPRLVDLLHLVVARVAPHVVNKLDGVLVWKRRLSQSL